MQLERIDGILQFFDGIQEVWDNYDVVIPDGLLIYCKDTRIIKKGDGNHLFSELPVWLDLKKIDSIHLLVQQLVPDVEDLEDLSITNSSAIVTLQDKILDIFDALHSIRAELQLDDNYENSQIIEDFNNRITALENEDPLAGYILPAPEIDGSSTLLENTSITNTITNYDSDATYTVSFNNSLLTGSITNDTITITAGDITDNQDHIVQMVIEVVKEGYLINKSTKNFMVMLDTSPLLPAPQLSGDSSLQENTSITNTITNYDSDATYTVSFSDTLLTGSINASGVITISAGDITDGNDHTVTMTVEVSKTGFTSNNTSKNITVLHVDIVADTALSWEGSSYSEENFAEVNDGTIEDT